MSAIDRLRGETAVAHRRLESTPFAKAAVEGRVDRRQYVDYLRALAVVLDTLRTQTQRHGSPQERAALARLPEWSEALAADLDNLAPASSLTNETAQRAAQRFARSIRRRVADGSAYLLGVAYVLVGSHRGNRSIAAKVEAALGLAGGEGTRYLRATRGEDGGPWQRFVDLLNRELSSPEAIGEAVEGARASFAAFERILGALGDEPSIVHHVSAINPEAGDHPIPQDRGRIALALDVADRAAGMFPYLGFRYGVRGQRFARSDGAWLLTLCELTITSATRQVDWLAGLLAARGIPSLCLEVHLQLLADALDVAGDDGGGAQLHRLARHVARHREALPRPRADELGLAHVAELGEGSDALLFSAAVDQRAGVADCADNIRAWAEAEPRLGDDSRREIHMILDRVAEVLAR